MPLSAARGNPARALLAGALLALLLGLLALVSASDAGVTLPGMAGLLADLRGIQRDMHRALVGAVRAVQQDGAAGPWLALLGVSFLYGIFHAAGPGHGKVLISSFLLADGGRLRAGILVSFAAAAVHALSAIALVGILAAVLQLSRSQITVAAGWLDSASYGAIALIGAWMLAGALRGDAHDHGHGHGHDHDHRHHHGPPAPGGSSWRRYAAVAIATGIRPCSGAVLVLLFTLGQGIFAMGVAATLAIALGTGVTVAVIASLTVLSRNTALALAGGDEAQGWRAGLGRALAIAGSLAVFALGALLLTASLGGGGPPL